MADRTVSVVLRARVTEYRNGIRQAADETRHLADEATNAREAMERHNKTMETFGTVALAAGGIAAGGLLLVAKAASEFGSKMAQLQSLSHATGSEMKQLGDAAKTAGQAYGFTAGQVADAEIELQKAGIGIKDQLGGALKGALTLAAAGQLDVGKATEIATVAMTQFGLSAGQVPHLADLLAAGADKALGSVGDLGDALKNGGLQAHNMGLSIDQTVGLLASFANAGIIGSEAGTQMRSMFIALQKPSAQARDMMDKYGISLTDASGKFIGMVNLGNELRDKLGGLTQAQRNTALATIFGSHAISGATAVYQASGAAAEKAGKSLAQMTKGVNDSGFASAQAAGKMNSLQGDVQKLSAAFQTDLIKMGSAGDGAFRGVVQSVTNVVTAVGNMPPAFQSAALAGTAIVAAVGLVGGATLLAIPKINAFRLSIAQTALTGRQAAGIFGKGSALLLGIMAVTSGLAGAGVMGTASAEDLAKAVDTIGGKFKNLDAQFKGDAFNGIKNARDALDASFGNGGLNAASTAKFLDSLPLSISHFSDVYKSNEATFNAFGQQLAALAQNGKYSQATAGFNQMVKAFGGGKDVLNEVQGASKDYREEIVHLLSANKILVNEENIRNAEQGKGAVGAKLFAAAQKAAAAAAEKQAEGLAKLGGQAAGATVNLDKLASAIEGFGSAQLDARGAARKLEGAFDDAMATIKKGGRTLSNFTAAGRANGDALDGIATAALQASSKYLTLNHDAKGAADVLQHGRNEFIKAAEAAGLGAKQAGKLADQLGLIPKNITAAVGIVGATGVKNTTAALSKGAKDFAKSYEATLRANGTPAAAAHKSAMAAAAKWDKQHPTATLDANNKKAVAAAKAANAQATSFAQKQYLAQLLANGVPAGQVIKMAKGMAKQFDALNVSATLDANPNPAIAGANAARDAINKVHGKTVTVDVNYRRTGSSPVLRADGGAIDGPGPKGKDSVFAMLAPGEHVLTDKDVDRLGGQAGVYRFRAALNAGRIPAFASGGAVATARNRVKWAVQDVTYAKARLKAATKATRATRQHALDLAERRLTTARQRLADLIARTKSSSDSSSKTADARKAAAEKRESIRQGREDFVSNERRNPGLVTSNPLGYVDQLRSMSRDTALWSSKQRKAFDHAANRYESALVKLSARSEKAAEKLKNLQDASTQMRESIKAAIAGGFTLGGYQQGQANAQPTTKQVESGWRMQDGVRVKTYSTVTTPAPGLTAGGIADYYKKGAASAKQFADALKRLAGKGLNANLLAELAQMGTEAGMPIAQALLSASASQLKSINANYTAIGGFADKAGKTVADDNYAKQIAAADKNADKITAQLKKDGEALRKLIAHAFGLKGYATGTSSATPGLHWVGERGPELLQFAGGERVTPIRSTPVFGGSEGLRVEVRMPHELALRDVDGTFRGMVRVEAGKVATQVMHTANDARAVLMVGGGIL